MLGGTISWPRALSFVPQISRVGTVTRKLAGWTGRARRAARYQLSMPVSAPGCAIERQILVAERARTAGPLQGADESAVAVPAQVALGEPGELEVEHVGAFRLLLHAPA